MQMLGHNLEHLEFRKKSKLRDRAVETKALGPLQSGCIRHLGGGQNSFVEKELRDVHRAAGLNRKVTKRKPGSVDDFPETGIRLKNGRCSYGGFPFGNK